MDPIALAAAGLPWGGWTRREDRRLHGPGRIHRALRRQGAALLFFAPAGWRFRLKMIAIVATTGTVIRHCAGASEAGCQRLGNRISPRRSAVAGTRNQTGQG